MRGNNPTYLEMKYYQEAACHPVLIVKITAVLNGRAECLPVVTLGHQIAIDACIEFKAS